MVSEGLNSQLRQAGLRITAPRQSVLEWLAGHPHATVPDAQRGARLPDRRGRGGVLGTCPTCQAPTGDDDNNPIRYEEVR